MQERQYKKEQAIFRLRVEEAEAAAVAAVEEAKARTAREWNAAIVIKEFNYKTKLADIVWKAFVEDPQIEECAVKSKSEQIMEQIKTSLYCVFYRTRPSTLFGKTVH